MKSMSSVWIRGRLGHASPCPSARCRHVYLRSSFDAALLLPGAGYELRVRRDTMPFMLLQARLRLRRLDGGSHASRQRHGLLSARTGPTLLVWHRCEFEPARGGLRRPCAALRSHEGHLSANARSQPLTTHLPPRNLGRRRAAGRGRTATFGPEFSGLARVAGPTIGWSLDNLGIRFPSPGQTRRSVSGGASRRPAAEAKGPPLPSYPADGERRPPSRRSLRAVGRCVHQGRFPVATFDARHSFHLAGFFLGWAFRRFQSPAGISRSLVPGGAAGRFAGNGQKHAGWKWNHVPSAETKVKRERHVGPDMRYSNQRLDPWPGHSLKLCLARVGRGGPWEPRSSGFVRRGDCSASGCATRRRARRRPLPPRLGARRAGASDGSCGFARPVPGTFGSAPAKSAASSRCRWENDTVGSDQDAPSLGGFLVLYSSGAGA